MKNAKRTWERVLILLVVIALSLCILISIGVLLWVLLHPADSDLAALGPGITAAILLIICIVFLRRAYSYPLPLALLSLVLAGALFGSGVAYIVAADFESIEPNLNYAEERAAWESTDPTPDTEITLSDILIMESSPDKTFSVSTKESVLADYAYFGSGIACFACAAAFFLYFFVWLARLFSPAFQKAKLRRVISTSEAAYAQIERFYELKEKGIMTEEEYQENRQRILDTLQ